MLKRIFLVLCVELLAPQGSAFAREAVSLAWAQSIQCPPVSGCYRKEGLFGVVEVKNLAYEKSIDIVYKPAWSDQWLSSPAQYLAPIDQDLEAWSFDIAGPVEAFAISFRVGDQTFWDNNHGHDYRLARYQLDAWLAPERALGGLLGGRSGAAEGLNAYVLVNPLVVKDGPVSVEVQGSGSSKTVAASRSQSLPSGVELWMAQVPLEGPVQEDQLRLSAFTGQFREDNYGQFWRVHDGTIKSR